MVTMFQRGARSVRLPRASGQVKTALHCQTVYYRDDGVMY